MDLDFIFIVNYECPGCHVVLENRSAGEPSWLRCPRCGRPSLAPDHQSRELPNNRLEKTASPLIGSFTTGSDVLVITPRSMAPMPPAVGQKNPNLPILLGIGFFAALFFSIVALMDANYGMASITGLGALLCLALIVGLARGSRE